MKKILLITTGGTIASVAGENGLATPAPQAHFRLCSELRSVIKKSCYKHESYDLDSIVVPLYKSARTYFQKYK